ncbi:unnamed protein product [Cyprideis torosa]|uniref:ATP synthase subunit b n=1 Tax=Cyprideis torosa TaxID=163714 RepID=A0A7R8WEV6_9CRUS|nr:unnamed protein product [Cyprideis torosa]CAG0896268.1 unnamed protein product [Cyprideis torosa]
MLSRLAFRVPTSTFVLCRVNNGSSSPLVARAMASSSLEKADKKEKVSKKEDDIKELFEKNIITGDPSLVIAPIEPIEDIYKVGPNYPSKTPKPERDLVNFPNVKIAEKCPPVRNEVLLSFFDAITLEVVTLTISLCAQVVLHFIPRSWFEFLYPKTGVSGGWVFLGGFLNFLLSKEWWVIEHEFYNGLSLLIIIYVAYTRFWPKAVEWGEEKQQLEVKKRRYIQEGNMEILRERLNDEKRIQEEARSQSMLFDAKRENVALQLETVFRQRQMEVFDQVKRRLDFQVEVQNAEGRIKQQHMVNWIVSQVQKALTPDLEKKALQQCLVDLKGLAAKA